MKDQEIKQALKEHLDIFLYVNKYNDIELKLYWDKELLIEKWAAIK